MNSLKENTIISPEFALHKIKGWCAYQERSQHETRQKLYSYKLHSEEVEMIISQLIGENFLNEERFALALTSGKFRMKAWGRNKIRSELKKHRVSEYLIDKAMWSINPEEYQEVMQKVISKKIKLPVGTDKRKLFYSILRYMGSRGFESELVSEELSNLLGTSNNVTIE